MTDLAPAERLSKPGFGREALKRTLDVALASVLIIVSSPVLLLMWCLVRCTSPGPAFFRQERVGRHLKPFTMLKLRSMYVDNDDQVHRAYVTGMLSADEAADGSAGVETTAPNGMLFKLVADPRITPFGRWLRKTSLDELPQLINVVRGDMSLVGPRPMLPWEAELLTETYRPRFAVRPGLTGLWQVSGRSRLTMRTALELDVEYVQRRSTAIDLMILARTVPALFRGGAS